MHGPKQEPAREATSPGAGKKQWARPSASRIASSSAETGVAGSLDAGDSMS